MADATETWRPVVGWEGWYEVSDHGRVRRVAPGLGTKPGHILTPWVDKLGYRRLYLQRNGQKQRFSLHHLVLEAFIGPRPDDLVCNHKDGDKGNNHLSNLEWVTAQANNQHAVRTGLWRPHRGDSHPTAKLTDAQVAEIRRLAGIEPNKITATRMGVTRSYVADLRRGKRREGIT